MKSLHSLLSSGLLALGLAGANIAPAQTAVGTALGDLILGFRQTDSGAQGKDFNVEVNLGSYSLYTSPASSSFVVTNIGADLSATYGASWNQNSTLKWGVVKAGGQEAPTWHAFISKANANPANGSTTPYLIGSTTNNGNPARSIDGRGGLLTQEGNPGQYTGIKNPDYAGINDRVGIVPVGNDTSWSTAGTFGGAQVFSAGGSNVDFTAAKFEQGTSFSFIEGVAVGEYKVVDLFELTYVSSSSFTNTYVGSFGLLADGTVTFATSADFFAWAVPEPSTYAAFAGAAALGFVVLRRRRRQRSQLAA